MNLPQPNAAPRRLIDDVSLTSLLRWHQVLRISERLLLAQQAGELGLGRRHFLLALERTLTKVTSARLRCADRRPRPLRERYLEALLELGDLRRRLVGELLELLQPSLSSTLLLFLLVGLGLRFGVALRKKALRAIENDSQTSLHATVDSTNAEPSRASLGAPSPPLARV